MKPRHQVRHARVTNVAERIATCPLREDRIAAAFDRFVQTGELPEVSRLAAAVVNRALRGGPPQPKPKWDLREAFVRMEAALKDLEALADEPEQPARPNLRSILFREAVHGDETERMAARLALRIEVLRGADVTSRQFLADRDPPDHAGLGLHLLGFPQCLAKPPYVEQAQRLFARQTEIRARINHDDPEWLAPIADAIRRFRRSGELPDDELLFDCVLADAELHALMRNYGGDGDPEVLAAFDAASRGDEVEQMAAIARLQDFARDGRLLRPLE